MSAQGQRRNVQVGMKWGASADVETSSSARAARTVASEDANASAALALLRIEAAIRKAESVAALRHVLANEVRKAVRARQVFVIDFAGGWGQKQLRITAASSLPTVDRNAPLINGLENGMTAIGRRLDLSVMTILEVAQLKSTLPNGGIALADYPVSSLLWVPMAHSAKAPFAGLLIAGDVAWTDHDAVVAERLAATGAHAWAALKPRATRRNTLPFARVMGACLSVACLAALFVPVPMAVLAPFEIIPRDASLVTAPIDGVISEVVAAPNKPVRKNAILIRFTDTELRNRLSLAERELQVAEARLTRANQLAFDSLDGRRELSIAQSEREVRRAERDYARELLEQTVIRAPVAGLAVFNDAKDMIGRPVKTGERLMDVADPAVVQARLEVPVADGYILAPGSEVRLFLDSEPLAPRAATIVRADYRAEAHTADRVSFRAYAMLVDLEAEAAPPRLGIRGTAQVYGDPVPLGMFLLRRPLAKARQWLGL